MFLIVEKLEETTTVFSQNDVTIMWCNLILQKTLYKVESQKILNLLNDSNNESSKFGTKKCHLWCKQRKMWWR